MHKIALLAAVGNSVYSQPCGAHNIKHIQTKYCDQEYDALTARHLERSNLLAKTQFVSTGENLCFAV